MEIGAGRKTKEERRRKGGKDERQEEESVRVRSGHAVRKTRRGNGIEEENGRKRIRWRKGGEEEKQEEERSAGNIKGNRIEEEDIWKRWEQVGREGGRETEEDDEKERRGRGGKGRKVQIQ